jgi:hypothetical protein
VRDQLERRLDTLRAEQQAGERMRARLQAEQTEVEQTLLRISGAIQVLEELLSPAAEPEPEPDLALLTTPPLDLTL